MLTKFGKQLRSLRIEKDLRLKDMADELGVTVAYLSAVENGKRAVPDFWIEKISRKYNLSNDETISIQKAAYENKKDIRISLEDANECETGLALSFARRFRTLSPEEVNALQKILDE